MPYRLKKQPKKKNQHFSRFDTFCDLCRIPGDFFFPKWDIGSVVSVTKVKLCSRCPRECGLDRSRGPGGPPPPPGAPPRPADCPGRAGLATVCPTSAAAAPAAPCSLTRRDGLGPFQPAPPRRTSRCRRQVVRFGSAVCCALHRAAPPPACTGAGRGGSLAGAKLA